MQNQNQYLDYSTDQSFQGLNKLFVLKIMHNKQYTQGIFF